MEKDNINKEQRPTEKKTFATHITERIHILR